MKLNFVILMVFWKHNSHTKDTILMHIEYIEFTDVYTILQAAHQTYPDNNEIFLSHLACLKDSYTKLNVVDVLLNPTSWKKIRLSQNDEYTRAYWQL